MTVERATEGTAELAEALARLLPQLSPGATAPGAGELEDLCTNAHVLVAREDGGRIVGSLTLVLYRIPTGVRGRIEDVVVDEAARGRGVGEALVREALRVAEAAGAGSVGLTSRPEREAANRLYSRLGFALRETNVYVWRPGV